MASPADTIMRILAMRQQQGAQNNAINQNAMDRFFRPVNAGIARGQTMANQRHLQGQSQAFQGDQNQLGRDLTVSEGEKNRQQQTGLQQALMGHRSAEAEKSRGFRGEQMDLDRDLTREGIEQRFRLQMAAIGARKQEGMAERANDLAMQHAAFKQRDDEFKKQTRVAFARDVRAAMEDAKGDQRRASASIAAITTRYSEEMKLQTAAAMMQAFASTGRGGGKAPDLLATPNAIMTTGSSILRGDARGRPFKWLTPEMHADIVYSMQEAWKVARKAYQDRGIKDEGGYFKMIEDSFKVLGVGED